MSDLVHPRDDLLADRHHQDVGKTSEREREADVLRVRALCAFDGESARNDIR